MKKLAGLGCLALLLCLPLQAGHRRSHHRGEVFVPAYVEIQVGTPYGGGVFVRGFRATPYQQYRRAERRHYRRERRGFVRFQHRRYFKAHRHYHYDGRCPY